eukprot:jgi/Chlat1/6653/Chrsp49S06125
MPYAEDDLYGGGAKADTGVSAEEVETIVKESIEGVLGQTAFQLNKINAWTSNVVEGCLKQLASLNLHYKYVVTCNLIQKTGGGVHTASTSLWDPSTDGKNL